MAQFVSQVCNFADLLNFGRSQTISLASRPKFSKNYESHTAITSIAITLKRIGYKSGVNLQYSVIARRILDSPKQSKKINPHEVRI